MALYGPKISAIFFVDRSSPVEELLHVHDLCVYTHAHSFP